MKVLIIDDDTALLTLLKEQFVVYPNYELFVADNEKDGLAYAKLLRPDVILLDVMMPQEGGLSVLQKLKKVKTTATIPVLMITAVRSLEARLQALRHYSEGYLEKPCTCDDIINAVEEVLTRRKTPPNKFLTT